LELRLDPHGRLAGTETLIGTGGEKRDRPLRALKVTEDGAIEYRTGFFGSPSGNFEEGGLVINGTTFKRAGSPPAAPVPFEKDGQWGYRDSAGKIVIPPRYQVAQEFSSEGIAAVVDRQGWACIDARGNVLVRPLVVDNGPDYFEEDLARFIRAGKVGFFDRHGKVAIEPAYDFAMPFAGGRAAVCRGCKPVRQGEHRAMRGGSWGFIDRGGALVIPLQFEEAASFAGGRARVRLGGRWKHIDAQGKTLP